MQPPIEKLDASMEELLGLVEQARPVLPADGYQKLKSGIQTLGYVTELLDRQEATLASLRKLLCPASTEKTAKVLEQAGLPPGEKTGASSKDRETTAKPDSSAKAAPQATKDPVPGHGRNGADAYEGAEKVVVPHALLKKGDACPLPCDGKLYPLLEPKVLLRIHGQAPIAATQYQLERLRCHSCGAIFTAAAPPGVGEKKYDETAVCMIALLRYGNGFPWNRLETLEANLGIPLPSGTQCDLLLAAAVVLACILQELIRQAAQGNLLHNDDTRMRVLQLERDSDISAKRTGVFTSGIVSIAPGYLVALYFTGCKHAGENLAKVLKQRAPGLDPPIQMCDALSRNVPKSFQTILANCNAHGRRQFIKPIENFPEECQFVLESFRQIYHYDDQAEQRKLSAEERLRFHQEHSRPVTEKLHAWLEAQFEEKKVEPNSGLGKSITYLLNHWEPLTLFLRKAGAPLDNNIVERALKQAIRHRKNSLFYKTRKGAAMGDLFMSLIHTCELNKVNPFKYLTELLRHAEELKLNPSAWMPWNYRQNLTQAAARAASG
jgi:transposase